MIIDCRKGDLLEAFKKGEVNVIAHCCNCFNTMGSGIALAIKQQFPEAYSADCTTNRGDVMKLGGYSRCVVDGKLIYNLYAQYRYGNSQQQLEYGSLAQSLRAMYSNLCLGGAYSEFHSPIINPDEIVVGIPKLGCGLAGGKWGIVKDIVNEILHDLDVIVYEL